MKKIGPHQVGIDRGEVLMFSDFEDGGAMWTGDGPRQRRKKILFSEPYLEAPFVHVSLSLWDVNSDNALRADISAQEITEHDFDLVFKTWGDTKVARVRVAWMAIGPLTNEDEWDLY